MLAIVQPSEFSGLRTGGPRNDFEVEGIIHQGGKNFEISGINALKTTFVQEQ